MYIDGYAYTVPKANKEAFIEFAQKSAEFFKKYGGLRVVEAWEDDVPEGKLTSFPMAVKRKEDEAILFSWCEWPDKATRDAAFEPIMKDMEAIGMTEMPFDGKRMIFGGFDAVIEL